MKATIQRVMTAQKLKVRASRCDARERVSGAEKRKHVDRAESMKTKTKINVDDSIYLNYFYDEIISQ